VTATAPFWIPFSPEAVVTEFAAVLKAYRVKEVTGDRYGGMWPRERFDVHGITYKTSERSKSDAYRDLLPALNGNRVELLDISKMFNQLCSLERRVARGGRDSIDHPPCSHDDVINCAALALTSLIEQPEDFYTLRVLGWREAFSDPSSPLNSDEEISAKQASPSTAANLRAKTCAGI